MWIKKVIVSYSRHKGNLKQLILAGLLLLSQGDILLAQSRMSAERAWADQFRQCTLVVIYPTFAVKHERIQASLDKGNASANNRRRAEKQMLVDRAYSDTFLLAMQQSFQAKYTLGSYAFVPDTAYYRWSKNKQSTRLLQNTASPHPPLTDSLDRLIILRHVDTENQTGTGISVWKASLGDGNVIPEKFPTSFRDGSLGMRFVAFLESFFRFSPKVLSMRDVKPDADYLASQLDSKWTKFLERWE